MRVTVLVLVLFGVSCTQLIGAGGDREEAECNIGDLRCLGSVRQECGLRYVWEDKEECTGQTPVCRRDKCLGIQQVTAGSAHSCAVLSDATVRCWGKNDDGQLGDGSQVSRLYPTEVIGLVDVASVAIGGSDDEGFTCAVHNSGSVSCWGMNSFNVLGSPTEDTYSAKPVAVPGLHDVAALALGWKQACAMHHDGMVSCWGLQAHSPDFTGQPPGKVAGIDEAIELVAAGLHTCARTKMGVFCWGHNEHQECGQPAPTTYVFPPLPVPALGSVKRLAAGYYHTCALTDESKPRVMCWGSDQCGQLAQSPSSPYCEASQNWCGAESNHCGTATPTPIFLGALGPKDRVMDIGAGAYHSCFVAEGGWRLYCWGRNDFGQVSLTSGSVVGMGTPFVAVPVPTTLLHTKLMSISVGLYHQCAIIDNGEVRCMGRNDDGQLGSGTSVSGPAVGVQWQEPQ